MWGLIKNKQANKKKPTEVQISLGVEEIYLAIMTDNFLKLMSGTKP